MPPPSDSPALQLIALPKAFYVVQFPQREAIPADIISELTFGRGEFFSITRTSEEVSVVGEIDERSPEACKPFATWGCIKVKGPMAHDLTGVMAALAAPLKEAEIPIFALSTWLVAGATPAINDRLRLNMDGAGPSSSANADASTSQRRVLPQRKRRGVVMGTEIDQTIIEAQKWRAEKPLLDPEQPIHLTTDSSYAETAIDLGRIVKTFKHEQYYTRPEVIELYRQQRNIATPDVVSLKDEPSLPRFRPREADKTMLSTAQSDEVYHKRHKPLEAHERRARLRELDMLRQEHRKLKERMAQLMAMDYPAFLQLPPESFSPVPPVDLSNHYTEEAAKEGERRREEMLEAARTLDERYQFLLREEPKPDKKSTKATPKPPPAPPRAIPVPVDEDMDVEVVDDDEDQPIRQEEVISVRPHVGAMSKPKNKGSKHHIIAQASTNPATPQAPNTVASRSGKRGGRPARKPPSRSVGPPASSLGKRRASSPASNEPAPRRIPTPPPPSSSAPSTRSTRARSIATSEANGVAMEVSDVRTPMPMSPPPPPGPMATRRPRIVPVLAPPSPITASPPPPIQPEEPPVVQAAAAEEVISRPRKRTRRSPKTPPPEHKGAFTNTSYNPHSNEHLPYHPSRPTI
ncbi:hypothetical protein NMY22_g13847 [Coprinellus aureogranulatus]|nr:hypothetical protein NMY22_g13847 [Coprinellus aureogranulatus]